MIHERPPDQARRDAMPTAYDKDIIQWAEEQARFLRSGHFDKLDLENLADEVLEVGKSEVRELKSRMAVLLAHLIKWAWQPSHRGRSWQNTIRLQRKQIHFLLKDTPSLKYKMTKDDLDFWESVWLDATLLASKETGIDPAVFPEILPWDTDQVMQEGWMPE